MTTTEAPVGCDRDRVASEALAHLEAHGVEFAAAFEERGGTGGTGRRRASPEDHIATALMDLYRRSGSADTFDLLVKLTRDQLLRRVRLRIQCLGVRVDPHELLQDALVNMFRYPDRFDGRRPGAFRAWSAAIVDNAVRRHLRRSRSGPDVVLRPFEVLAREPYRRAGPAAQAANAEDCLRAARAWSVLLQLYLAAYHRLSERERLVLYMVEVRGKRYAEVAKVLGMRPEALKMVVFRARRRILDRISGMLPGASQEPPRARAAG